MGWKDFVEDLGFKEGLVVGSVVVALLLVGCWLWVERADVQLLDVMTAFGTVGAVIVAVTVPIRQNRNRLREQRYDRLLVDWVVVQDVFQMCHKLRAMAHSFVETWEGPASADTQHLYAQLEFAKQSTVDNLGRLIINDLLQQVLTIQDGARRRATISPKVIEIALTEGRKPGTYSDMEQSAERLDKLSHMISSWIDRLLLGFDQIGRSPLNRV